MHRMYAPQRIHAIANFQLAAESVNAHLGTMLRQHSRRVAALSKHGDRSHWQILGGMRDRFADGFGYRITMIFVAPPRHARQLRHAGLRFKNDAGHHRHGFQWIAAASRFSRQHDNIAAIKNCIRYIAGLRPCGTRVLSH